MLQGEALGCGLWAVWSVSGMDVGLWAVRSVSEMVIGLWAVGWVLWYVVERSDSLTVLISAMSHSHTFCYVENVFN